MIFTSIDFLVLLGITFFIYYLPFFRSLQRYILILSSLFFYSYNKPIILTLILTSILVNAFISYFISIRRDESLRKRILCLGILFNVLFLGFYKYKINFFTETELFVVNAPFLNSLVNLALPIGISFYTFQAISLLVDTYKRDHMIKVENKIVPHLINTSVYLSFFPQLISGPIVKAHGFLFQIKPKSFLKISWDKVTTNLIYGYFLKMVIADNLSFYVPLLDKELLSLTSSLELALYLFSYTIYIFSDFAGYSYIAIGLGALFGYELPENFNFPFLAQNFSEFWRRWHISLSNWLTEYVYIPIGGNQKGRIMTIRNLIFTMLIGGLWHGSTLNFAFWGILHGIVLVLERFSPFKLPSNLFFRIFKRLRTFFIFSILLLFYRYESFSSVQNFFKFLALNNGYEINNNNIASILVYCFIVIAIHLFHQKIKKDSQLQIYKFSYIFYGVLLLLIFSDHGLTDEFYYYRF